MDIGVLKDELLSINAYIYFDENEYLREKPKDPEVIKAFVSKLEVALKHVEEDEDVYFLQGTLGNLYRILGQPEKAIAHLTRSLEVAIEKKDEKKEVVSYIRLGEALKYDNQHEMALHYFNRAFTYCEKSDLKVFKDFALQHKGKCLLEQGKLDEALSCFHEALEIRKAKNEPSLIDSTEQAIQLVAQIR
ncbi:tetratricopeptide repeat protein [Pseudalkalibacillus sp. SCS-8]|uniref:tetratricopeptide repeat protein n=1 Tax=Pseudalkalibacillus nanhaiensis TaxID=3115291 RepID=UPI0032DBD2BE